MVSIPGLGDTSGRAESMLGRRLRPWWGVYPGSLIARGVVGAIVFGVIIYGAHQVRAGELDLAATGLEDSRELIDLVALGVGGAALLGVLYKIVQIAVGAFDLFVRRSVEGRLVQAQERRTGDFLPGIVQMVWFRSRDSSGMNRSVRRRTRYEVVLSTPHGPKSWNVNSRHFAELRGRPGARSASASARCSVTSAGLRRSSSGHTCRARSGPDRNGAPPSMQSGSWVGAGRRTSVTRCE